MFTLRCHRIEPHDYTNKVIATLTPLNTIVHTAYATAEPNAYYEIYPCSANNSRTFFDPFPPRLRMHVLCRIDGTSDVRPLMRTAAHDVYPVFKLPAEATPGSIVSIYVLFAANVAAAVSGVRESLLMNEVR